MAKKKSATTPASKNDKQLSRLIAEYQGQRTALERPSIKEAIKAHNPEK